MQAMVSSLEMKIDETEKKYEEASKISEERLKQALDAETKIIQLKTAMQRWLYWSRFFCNVGHRLEYRSMLHTNAEWKILVFARMLFKLWLIHHPPPHPGTLESPSLSKFQCFHFDCCYFHLQAWRKIFWHWVWKQNSSAARIGNACKKDIRQSTDSSNSSKHIVPNKLSLSLSLWLLILINVFCYLQRLENGHHVSEENKANVVYFFLFLVSFVVYVCSIHLIILLFFSLLVIYNCLFLQELQSATPVKKFGTESDSKFRRSLVERQHVCVYRNHYFLHLTIFYLFIFFQGVGWLILTFWDLLLLQENVDALISCVMKNIGFSHGKPVAAFTIYKCLLHWKSFEAERTSVFDRLIQMIGSAIEVTGLLYLWTFSMWSLTHLKHPITYLYLQKNNASGSWLLLKKNLKRHTLRSNAILGKHEPKVSPQSPTVQFFCLLSEGERYIILFWCN